MEFSSYLCSWHRSHYHHHQHNISLEDTVYIIVIHEPLLHKNMATRYRPTYTYIMIAPRIRGRPALRPSLTWICLRCRSWRQHNFHTPSWRTLWPSVKDNPRRPESVVNLHRHHYPPWCPSTAVTSQSQWKTFAPGQGRTRDLRDARPRR